MLPNIDTHRHLGGSIPVTCVWDIISTKGYAHLASNIQDVQTAMTFSATEPKEFHRFLDKFKILDQIRWTEELIDLSIKAVCDEFEKENLAYCWLDFSINKYMHIGWHKHEAIRFIYDRFQQYRPNKVGLILSLKYESLRHTQRQYAKLIDTPDVADILFGLDLVGDEAYFDANFYAPLFADWNKANKMLRAHVGESQTAKNVRFAIKKLHVTNIAHGIKIFEDTGLTEIAVDAGVTFDLAITSNYLTGVLGETIHHPIVAMLDAGLIATLGSDDPIQCSTNLATEFALATKYGCSEGQLNQIKKTAITNTLKYRPTAQL